MAKESKLKGRMERLEKAFGVPSSVQLHGELVERGLECNYPYFRKIAKGQTLPSPALLTQLAKACPAAEREGLVLAWCQDALPAFSHLFKASAPPHEPTETFAEREQGPPEQKDLTPRQVAALSASFRHYLVFLLLTLARRGLPTAEIEKALEATPGKESASSILEDLAQAKIARREAGRNLPVSTDVRFPARSKDLEKVYAQLDQWDEQVPASMRMRRVNRRRILRRVSPASVALINQHLELIFSTIKRSDDTDPEKNGAVVHFAVELFEGHWPG
jgi:hypothetical protein